MVVKIYADGSPTKVAYYIDNMPFVEVIEFSTNFEAEYKSIIAALHKLSEMEHSADRIVLVNDNAVVISQLKGMARVKEQRLKLLYDAVMMLVDNFNRLGVPVEFVWVCRKENRAGGLI